MWYRRAATQGEPTAQSYLCRMRLHGDAMRPNLKLALMWCDLSIENGGTGVLHLDDQVMQQMTAKQVQAAQVLIEKGRQTFAGRTAGRRGLQAAR